MAKDLLALEEKLHYHFRDPNLITKALSHKSQANERRRAATANKLNFVTLHNERLEYLGDAVLQLVISDILWERFPHATEGKLSKMRSSLVNERTLAEVARSIELGPHLLLGKGEISSGGCEKSSILSSTYEAVLGAIYVEGGLDQAFVTIEKNFESFLSQVEGSLAQHDYKSMLQEQVQSRYRKPPTYTVHKVDGPDHSRTFEVMVSVSRYVCTGQGTSKKQAEQMAARLLLEKLDKQKKKTDAEEKKL